MKNKIPFEKIKDFYEKYGKMSIKSKEQMQEFQKALNEQFDIMRSIKAKDFESLTLEEFGKIPIGWLFDWNKITGTFEDESKILQLYKSCDTQSLPKKEELKKFDYEDINKILPNEQLRFYLKNILIYDEDFIADIDKCMWSSQENNLANKSVEEKLQYFNNNIGNTSRTYIYKLFALKHLYNILLKNMNYYIDEFWLNRLNRVLQEKNSVDDFYNKIGKAIAHSCNIQTEEKQLALQEIIDRGNISISCLQRIFHISFSNAASIIKEAMSFGFIKKERHAYTIINKKSLKQYLIDTLIK